MIVFICIFTLIALAVAVGCIKVFEKNPEKGSAMFMVASLICFVLMLSCLSVSAEIARDGAESVSNYDGHTIYHDAEDDTYFVIECGGLWNPLKLRERVHLDAETVEKYIDLTNQINDLDVLGKESD
jgi:hypothetical protein